MVLAGEIVVVVVVVLDVVDVVDVVVDVVGGDTVVATVTSVATVARTVEPTWVIATPAPSVDFDDPVHAETVSALSRKQSADRLSDRWLCAVTVISPPERWPECRLAAQRFERYHLPPDQAERRVRFG